MIQSEYDARVRDIKGTSDHWINRGKESDTEHMYCDLLISLRDSILLLSDVVTDLQAAIVSTKR